LGIFFSVDLKRCNKKIDLKRIKDLLVSSSLEKAAALPQQASGCTRGMFFYFFCVVNLKGALNSICFV